jgi:hypothetical protein
MPALAAQMDVAIVRLEIVVPLSLQITWIVAGECVPSLFYWRFISGFLVSVYQTRLLFFISIIFYLFSLIL